MNPCFADTFFFLALLNRGDEFHDQALALNRIDRPIVTTGWIIVELGDHLCDLRNRPLFGQVWEALKIDRRFEILPQSQTVLDSALTLYDQRLDKEWSLTDCTSFVTMTDQGITEALTGDRHFEQSGFKALFV
jgi:uncharacterized protein